MKRYREIAFAAALVCAAFLSATTQVYAKDKHHHHGRNAAIGVLGAAAALAIISNSARADDRSDHDDEDDNQCRRWKYRCDDGAGWACRKFDRNC